MMFALRMFLVMLAPQIATAYPEFIGYGYSSCVTCHFNGLGNGPLNDYGRALLSAEISARHWTGKRSDDELGASSTFLGLQQLPWWLKPGIKTRNLAFIRDPGGSGAKTETIFMQADVNVAVLLDKKAKLIAVGAYGYAPKPVNFKTQHPGKTEYNWISREHYIRWSVSKPVWLYFGMMDKAYGIRIVNHTAYSRRNTGLAQNDQSHGVILQYLQPTYEISANAFIGNLYQDADLRQKGISSLWEFDLQKDWRLGASALVSTNDYVMNERLAMHSRFGLTEGSSWLFELGAIRDTPKTSNATLGYYSYTQVTQKFARGYHLFMNGQAYKKDMNSKNADKLKFGTGILAFPYPGVEVRIEAENGRDVSSSSVNKEGWTLLSQLHLSL